MFLAWLSLALEDAKEQRQLLGRENSEQSVSRRICDSGMPAVGMDGVAFLGTFNSPRFKRVPAQSNRGRPGDAKSRDAIVTWTHE
jgi:hypothetical protein